MTRGQSTIDRSDDPIPTIQRRLGNQTTGRILAQRHNQGEGQQRQGGETRSSEEQTEEGQERSTVEGTIKTAPRFNEFPWRGRITGAWSVALRETPRKDPERPHWNTLADLPRDSYVRVIARESNWLHVEVDREEGTISGYVSGELVEYVRPGRYEFEEPEQITGRVIDDVASALVVLRQARAGALGTGPDGEPDELAAGQIQRAIDVIEADGRYEVDESTYEASFVDSEGVQIETIEDFVLFVETVERAYPSARPAEIATEIRQIWFSDANWDMMVASAGVRDSEGALVDVESQAPIADQFDMAQIDAGDEGLTLQTPAGTVDVGHVMAGIDATLSVGRTVFPARYLRERDNDSLLARTKFDVLSEAHGGDVRDFATWAGDLGQAYAEYLVARRVADDSSATLSEYVSEKATDEELLGDVHGYVAWLRSADLAAETGIGGRPQSVSDILYNTYLVETSSEEGTTYREYFERFSGASGNGLRGFVRERVLAFARPWYAKKAYDERGYWGSDGWTPSGVLEGSLEDFDEQHEWNDDNAAEADTLETLIDSFMERLDKEVR